jgi:hypothetical protein
MKGYSIQTINGKKFPMKWGLNQSMFYCELKGISIDKMNKEFSNLGNDISILRDLLWSAFKDGARVDGSDFTLTNFDIADLMEDMEGDELTVLIASMTETLPKARPSTKKKALK